MEPQIRTLGLIISALAAIYALKRRGDMPALIFAALGPMVYFSQHVGFVLTPGKLIGLIYLAFIVVNTKYLQILKNKYLRPFLVYYVYVIFLTLIMAFFWPENSAQAHNILYGSVMRGLVQIIQVFIGLAIVLMVIGAMTSTNSLYRMQITMLVTAACISIYGIYVWFAQKYGLPYNPITRRGGEEDLSYKLITTRINGIKTVRAYSLTGEPKGLAIDAASGVMLAYFTSACKEPIFRFVGGRVFLITLFLITLYLTYSTAGYLIMPTIFLVGLAAQLYARQVKKGVIPRFFIFGFLAVTGSYILQFDLISTVFGVFEERVENRIGENGLYTFAEAAIVEFWWQKPQFVISGAGLGGSSFYIREFNTESYAGRVAAPRGIYGFIGDRGIIGLVLFYYALSKPVGILFRASRMQLKGRHIYLGMLVICLVFGILLLTRAPWYVEWLLIALACASASIGESEMKIARNQLQNHAYHPHHNLGRVA